MCAILSEQDLPALYYSKGIQGKLNFISLFFKHTSFRTRTFLLM